MALVLAQKYQEPSKLWQTFLVSISLTKAQSFFHCIPRTFVIEDPQITTEVIWLQINGRLSIKKETKFSIGVNSIWSINNFKAKTDLSEHIIDIELYSIECTCPFSFNLFPLFRTLVNLMINITILSANMYALNCFEKNKKKIVF